MQSGLLKNGSKKPVLRIDDRLIHGQVVVGWGERLGFRRIILAHDESAENEDLKQLYLSLMPPEINGFILSIENTAKYLSEVEILSKTMIITETINDSLKLIKLGLEVESIIIGGLHHRPGSRELLSYVFIDEERTREISKLLKLGIKVNCQDLPDNTPFIINDKTLGLE